MMKKDDTGAACLTILIAVVVGLGIAILTGLAGTWLYNSITFAPDISYPDGLRVALLVGLLAGILKSEVKVDK